LANGGSATWAVLSWNALSTEGKLGYITVAAPYHDVRFENFKQALQEILGEQPVSPREEASLRLLLGNERELCELSALLPRDQFATESVPLVDRFKEVLDGYAFQIPGNAGRGHDALLAEVREEYSSDEDSRLTERPKQEEKASAFKRLTGMDPGAENQEASGVCCDELAIRRARNHQERDRDENRRGKRGEHERQF